jgi:hypothetical protein
MKNKFFVILSIIALVAIVVALDYGDAQAVTKAKSTTTEGWAQAWCVCHCPEEDRDGETQSGGTVEASAECNIPDPACHILDHAFGWKANPEGAPPDPWKVAVFDSMAISKLCLWGYGKGDKALVYIMDSAHVVMDYSPFTDSLDIEVYAFLLLDDFTDRAQNKLSVEIKKDNVPPAEWWGAIELLQSDDPIDWREHVVITGNWADDWDGQITGDGCLRCSVHVYDAIPFEGDFADWTVSASALKRVTTVPTMTQWGVIILAALIVASAVYIMVRRRRATVPA